MCCSLFFIILYLKTSLLSHSNSDLLLLLIVPAQETTTLKAEVSKATSAQYLASLGPVLRTPGLFGIQNNNITLLINIQPINIINNVKYDI